VHPNAATDILRAYARLVGRLTGARAVSLYVPSAAGSGREILIHEGPLPPLPELADAHAADGLARRIAAAPAGEAASLIVRSVEATGVLYNCGL
jgi:hypothetical protein